MVTGIFERKYARRSLRSSSLSLSLSLRGGGLRGIVGNTADIWWRMRGAPGEEEKKWPVSVDKPHEKLSCRCIDRYVDLYIW